MNSDNDTATGGDQLTQVDRLQQQMQPDQQQQQRQFNDMLTQYQSVLNEQQGRQFSDLVAQYKNEMESHRIEIDKLRSELKEERRLADAVRQNFDSAAAECRRLNEQLRSQSSTNKRRARTTIQSIGGLPSPTMQPSIDSMVNKRRKNETNLSHAVEIGSAMIVSTNDDDDDTLLGAVGGNDNDSGLPVVTVSPVAAGDNDSGVPAASALRVVSGDTRQNDNSAWPTVDQWQTVTNNRQHRSNKNVAANGGGGKAQAARNDSAQKVGKAQTARNDPAPKKVSPIQLEKMDAAKLGALFSGLATETGRNDFTIRRFGEKTNPRLICADEDAKAAATRFLENNNIQFNGFNTADTRRRAYIIRGLCYESDDDALNAVQRAIQAIQLDGKSEISRFVTAYQRFHPGAHAPLYKVVIGAEADERSLLSIRTIGYCDVRIERMNKSAVVQCRRCQRYHHTTGQCHYQYRCVQCANVHEWGQCPRSTNEGLAVGCTNCKEAGLQYIGHTANDLKNCNFFAKSKGGGGNKSGNGGSSGAGSSRGQSRTAATSNVSVKPSSSNNGVSHDGRSYAAMVKAPAPKTSANGVKGKEESKTNWDDEERVAFIVAAVIRQLRRDGH